jgi:hypothetical protein
LARTFPALSRNRNYIEEKDMDDHEHRYTLTEFVYRSFWVCYDCGHEPTETEFYDWADKQNA